MHCFTWENFTVYYHENDLNLSDTILSEVSITVKKHEMPLYSKLLPIWSGGDPEIWSNQGRSISSMEDLKV